MISVGSLEFHVSYHCNLSCRNCMHMTPLEEKHFISQDELALDLNKLKGIVVADEIRILGGEPLLNKDLASLVKIVKESRIGKRVSLSTNGLLLHSWKDENSLWSVLDFCEVSVYKSFKKAKETIVSDCVNVSKKNKLTFVLYFCDKFRQAGSLNKCNDQNITRNIFETCLVSKNWQCFNIFEGRFYICPQALGFSRFNPKVDIDSNSISLDSPHLEEDIYNFINRKEPLQACSYCYGCVGKLFEHEQVNRENYLLDFQSDFCKDRLDVPFMKKIQAKKGVGFSSLDTIEKVLVIKDGNLEENF